MILECDLVLKSYIKEKKVVVLIWSVILLLIFGLIIWGIFKKSQQNLPLFFFSCVFPIVILLVGLKSIIVGEGKNINRVIRKLEIVGEEIAIETFSYQFFLFQLMGQKYHCLKTQMEVRKGVSPFGKSALPKHNLLIINVDGFDLFLFVSNFNNLGQDWQILLSQYK